MVNESRFDNYHSPFLNLCLFPRRQAMGDLVYKFKKKHVQYSFKHPTITYVWRVQQKKQYPKQGQMLIYEHTINISFNK